MNAFQLWMTQTETARTLIGEDASTNNFVDVVHSQHHIQLTSIGHSEEDDDYLINFVLSQVKGLFVKTGRMYSGHLREGLANASVVMIPYAA